MQVSLSEYLKTHYRPDCEYIDGQLVERNVGMFDQSWMMGQAIFHFEQYRESLGLLSLPSLRVQVSSTRFRVPDVTVVRGDPHEQILTHPPFLLIEILSPEDSVISMLEKIDDYLASEPKISGSSIPAEGRHSGRMQTVFTLRLTAFWSYHQWK